MHLKLSYAKMAAILSRGDELMVLCGMFFLINAQLPIAVEDRAWANNYMPQCYIYLITYAPPDSDAGLAISFSKEVRTSLWLRFPTDVM